jgi:hypothetical protein
VYDEKSITRRTALPLALVAATFFLPMADSCNHAVSPLTYVAEGGVASAIWLIPTFITAEVLAVAVFRSWRQKAKTASAFATMSAFALTLPVLGVLFAFDGARVMAPIYAVATLVTAWLMKRARAKMGWERLSALLDAYAVAAFPLSVTIAALARYSGAYVFVIAYVAFATQRALVALQSVSTRAQVVRTRVAAEDARARIAEPTEAALDDDVEIEARPPRKLARSR